MADPLAYDMPRALAYIESLQRAPDRLVVEEIPDKTIRIQPTIGMIAAGLVDLLVRCGRTTRILDIGTSMGYSACVLGRAARPQGGRVLSIEVDERIARVARENIAAAGLADTVEILVADAKAAIRELDGRFGLILQDGHKDDYLPMLDRLIELLEPAGCLISDDVLFPVMNLPVSAMGWARAIDRYNQGLKSRSQLHTIWLPIGDGIAVSVKA
jgi:predicted O-methyltransferase YrrM